MKNLMRTLSIAGTVCFFLACTSGKEDVLTQDPADSAGVSFWMTTGDKVSLLQPRGAMKFKDETSLDAIIEVDSTARYQSIDGFGYALTGGSADLIHGRLPAADRAALLKELFGDEENSIGVSYLRVSIGASDLDDHVFSYCDLPPAQTDPSLQNFSLKEDEDHLIPLLKEILAVNPEVKIMGSPWSAPPWMKTNNLPKGGSLLPEFYDAYALYFVKYIQGMAEAGIAIDAVTLQNEPENPYNTPSMLMTAEEEANFVKHNLGPAFQQAGIKTKIVVFDHNCDHPQYPISILDDKDARPYVDGSAFHLYIGEIEALSKVHEAHPDKNLYFTEQWTSGEGKFYEDLRWHTKNLIVGATRNWSRNVLEWNLAADPNFNPHTGDGGCTTCMGALTVGSPLTRNVSYYIIAHASKFVKPGSIRIGSNIPSGLYNVAFLTPEGKKVVIVVNDNDERKSFAIKSGDRFTEATLASGAVGTFVW
jgi:glucosylceramidase